MPSDYEKSPNVQVAANLSAAQIQTMLQQALAFHQTGQFEQARALYDDILKIDPPHFNALHLLGVLAHQTDNHIKAVELIGKAIDIFPNNPAFYLNLGSALQALKQLDAAIESYDKALALKNDYANAHFNRGVALQGLGQLKAAVASYDHAIAAKPDYAHAYSNRGNALAELKRLDEAIESYDRAIAIDRRFAEVYFNRGGLLAELGQFDAAVQSYDQAIESKHDYAEAYSGRSVALAEQRKFDAALSSCERALKILPNYAEAYSNRGAILAKLKRFDAAMASYDRAIAIAPDLVEAYSNRGNAFKELGHLDAALASYDRAIEIKPDFAEAYYNRGNIYHELKKFEAAMANYDEALALDPNIEYVLGRRLYTKMSICDWSFLDEDIARLSSGIQGGKRIALGFPLLGLTANPSLQRQAAEIWVNHKFPADGSFGPIAKRARSPKIRIGYYSADFRTHAVTQLTAGLFEHHDRTKFELTAFSFGSNKKDDMRNRVSAAFDKFVDVENLSDGDVVKRSRELGIDIAVDLMGFTQDNRAGIFASRAAPIQINYIGYPGTMGADYIDYIIADETVIPERAQSDYSERIIYLPNSFQANDDKLKVSGRLFTRAELGLPETGFVFCCFNNNYKITPDTFDSWMRIIGRAEGSVLWLFVQNQIAAANLRKEAAGRGVDPRRLVFAEAMPMPEHLARHRAADLFLDTLPFNAGATASCALWAGLPVLTLTGDAFASRMGASLLSAIQVPELITHRREDYEALAVELATDWDRLEALKRRLAENRLTAPLFDTKLFATNLEQAYTQIYNQYQADLPPDHIYFR